MSIQPDEKSKNKPCKECGMGDYSISGEFFNFDNATVCGLCKQEKRDIKLRQLEEFLKCFKEQCTRQ